MAFAPGPTTYTKARFGAALLLLDPRQPHITTASNTNAIDMKTFIRCFLTFKIARNLLKNTAGHASGLNSYGQGLRISLAGFPVFYPVGTPQPPAFAPRNRQNARQASMDICPCHRFQ
jgi:hypothetical protein